MTVRTGTDFVEVPNAAFALPAPEYRVYALLLKLSRGGRDDVPRSEVLRHAELLDRGRWALNKNLRVLCSLGWISVEADRFTVHLEA